MKRTQLKRRTPLKRGPWTRKPKAHRPCFDCKGSGTRFEMRLNQCGHFTCPTCNGSGKKRDGIREAFPQTVRQPNSMQRHKWMKRRSDKKKIDDEIYDLQRAIYLKENPWCQLNITCGARIIRRNIAGVVQQEAPRRATQIHHTCGRGKMYLVMEKWKGSCAPCHYWENSHRNEAVELGLRERVYEKH